MSIASRNKRILNNLYAPFATDVDAFMKECERRGLRVKLLSGNRTWTEQAKIYAQGRTAPGKKVTKARPGESWHNYGVAADLCFKGPVPFPNPDPKISPQGAALWGDFGAIAKDFGFVWGGDWGWDFGHVRQSYGLTLDEAQRIYKESGLIGVYVEFERRIKIRLEAQSKAVLSVAIKPNTSSTIGEERKKENSMIETKTVEYAKELDDVNVALIELVKDIKAGKDIGQITSENLPTIIAAVDGADQVGKEVEMNRKVALQTIGYRGGELVDVFLPAPAPADAPA